MIERGIGMAKFNVNLDKIEATISTTIDVKELLLALIEQRRLSSNLPKILETKKENGITVNGVKFYGSFTPYAMRTDKNGYPHFLFYINNVWVWLSAKYFKP